MLHNGSATATLGYYGLVSLTVQNTSMNISADGFAIDLNATTYTVAKLPTPQVQQLDSASLMYSYALPQAGQSLRVTYSLSPTFIAKRITLLTGGLPVLFGNITPWYQLELTSSANLQTTIRATGVLGGDEAGFLRFADQAGVFLLAQNPLLELQWMQPAALNINRFSVGYWAGLAYDPQIYGEQTFDADDGIMGLYRLAGRPVPTPARNLVTKLSYWGNSAVGDSPVLDTAERDAVTTAAAAYYIAPPTTQTVKKHVGWCENDYQIDLANATSAAEYHRVMQTLNAIGATTVTFAPSDSSVSTRKNCTDSYAQGIGSEGVGLVLGKREKLAPLPFFLEFASLFQPFCPLAGAGRKCCGFPWANCCDRTDGCQTATPFLPASRRPWAGPKATAWTCTPTSTPSWPSSKISTG